jgi:glycosyltransferase involved in cell wall biosynthesis
MLLTLIVPTKNEQANIERILDSILNNKYFDSQALEVIVIDNPDTSDKTEEIAKKFDIKYFTQGPERSAQRNLGITKAQGEWVCFLDADMAMTQDLLQEILSTLRGLDTSDKVQFAIKERIPGNKISLRARNMEKTIYDNNLKISASRIFRREDLEKYGGFNPEMISGEDWELNIRIAKLAGNTIKFFSHPLMHHEENMILTKTLQKKTYYAKNLKNYKVGSDVEVNPIYRISILFSRPDLIVKDPFAWMYMMMLKASEFGVGFVVYIATKFKK